jgi:protein-S-isoprenylcysteine O-methyltransferase Ste14
VSERRDRAGVIAPPPLIYAAVFLAGLAIRYFWWMPIPFGRPAAAVFLVLSLAMLAWATAAMRRARTSMLPYKPTTALVTSGPFRFTRNPLYLSLNLGYISAALWIDALPALLLVPVALAILHFGVILREESYLEAKFGDAYRDYRRRVPRWF